MFDSKFYTNNRNKLADKLQDSLIVISANSMLQKSADTTYPFKQDSNFWYLTGVNEPDLVLIIDTKLNKTTILLPEINDYQKEWDGEIDTKSISDASGINNFESQAKLLDILKNAVKHNQKISYLKPLDELVQPYNFYSNPARRKLYEKISSVTDEAQDVRLEIARLRQVKQPEELIALQKAIDITGNSLDAIKSRIESFRSEAELCSALTSEFYSRGADGHGFEPIIASSKNASIIHYKKNNNKVKSNSLILLDVGAEYSGYSADISRTWSVGKITSRQQEVYDAVVELQDIAFNMLKPGVIIREYQQLMEIEAKKIMKKLGMELVNDKYPHGFSHFLGIDVHDAGDYDRALQENNVITVEPGIYLADEGIGVRIEDDVLITAKGIEVLSSRIPRIL